MQNKNYYQIKNKINFTKNKKKAKEKNQNKHNVIPSEVFRHLFRITLLQG